MTSDAPTREHRAGFPWWEVIAITAVALAVRVVHLDVLHSNDDYYQLLAALSWLRDGTLSIAGGLPYERASLHTYIVAGFMRVLGETSWVARLPAALAGAASVTLLFVWLRAAAGRIAAWAGGLLLCFDPLAILLSGYVRFYTLHTLVFLAAALGVYRLATQRWFQLRSTTAVALGVVAALGVAVHVHSTTAIGVIALFVWLVLELGSRALHPATRRRPSRVAWVAGIGGAGLLIVGVALVQSGLAGTFWGRFRGVPLWAAEHQDAVGYYFRSFQRAYPVFWGLFPVAAAVSVARVGRPAVFCVVLFAVPFLLHSFAAFKADRFLSYAYPFFFATWGIAIGVVLPAVHRAAHDALSRGLSLRWRPAWLRLSTWVVMSAMIAGVLLTNRAFTDSYRLVRPWEPPALGSRPDWAGARPLLAGAVDSVDVVVGAFGPELLYHLGRVDVVVAADHVPASDPREFVQARQMGKPAITEPESMALLIRCFPSGLVVSNEGFWSRDWGLSEAFTQVVMDRADPVPLPEGMNLRAYRWAGEEGAPVPPDCPVLQHP